MIIIRKYSEVVWNRFLPFADSLWIALAVAIPVSFVVIAALVTCVLRRRSHSAQASIADSLILASNSLYTDRTCSEQLLQDWPRYEQYQYDRNKLDLTEVVGEGQFGKVYLARAIGIIEGEEETMVAVKTAKVQSAEAAEDFRKEIEIMMAFRHPNIISLLGVCTKEFPLYIILEFMSEV